MAENGASSSSSSSLTKEKPVIVRVKRKLNQTRFDGFWLQIHERPSKRTLLDFSKLSISDSATEKVQEEQKWKKLFVQLVDTVTQLGAIDSVLQSYLTDLSDLKETKIDARRKTFKQGKKPDELRQVARQKHDELAKNARFEQIWKSRKGNKDSHEESLREICHLYDVVQVDDSNEEKLPEMEKTRLSRIENDAIMCNYLPLLREFIPSAAKEIESDFLSTEDNYVYDLYTVENDAATKMADVADGYPLVQVDENNGDDDFYDGPDKSDYDTDDSNAEDNPLYDYPDEESEEEEEEKDEFDVFEEEEEEYEREILDFDGDNDNDDDEREVEYWRLGHC